MSQHDEEKLEEQQEQEEEEEEQQFSNFKDRVLRLAVKNTWLFYHRTLPTQSSKS